MADDLTPLVSTGNDKPQDYSHLKTYTAGEDKSRLAEMAKEFGLQHQRKPRKQVRDPDAGKGKGLRRGSSFYAEMFGKTGKKMIEVLALDSSLEVARMRAVYSLGYSHGPRGGSYHEYGDADLGGGYRERHGSTMPDWLEQIEHEEEDLHAHGIGGDLTSAVLGIVKGMVGPAILYLPHGLAGAGYALAFPMLIVSTTMFLYSSQCLLDSWRLEHDKMHKQLDDVDHKVSDAITEGDEGDENDDDEEQPLTTTTTNKPRFKMTFLSYPELGYRALGENFERIIKLGIGLMQSGVCLSYLIFVPQNGSAAFEKLTGIYLAPEWFLLVMVAIQVPLSWIRDIRKLTTTNLLANTLILFGLITCLFLSLRQAMTTTIGADFDTLESPLAMIGKRLKGVPAFAKDWFLFIGTCVSSNLLHQRFWQEVVFFLTSHKCSAHACFLSFLPAKVFLFEGTITLLVPLQEAVVSEEDRKRFPKVYRTTIVSIICFYIFFSTTCLMSLGNGVRTTMTTSLPVGNAATTVQLAYSVAVLFTFPFQNFPALEISCRAVANTMDSLKCCGSTGLTSFFSKRNVISSVMVALLAVVGMTTMNSLDKVVSLMGGLLGCPIAFIFPPLIHLQLMGSAGLLTPTRKFFNYVVIFMGVVATFIATFTTILTWNKK